MKTIGFPYKLIKKKKLNELQEAYANISEEINIAAEFVKGIEEGNLDVSYTSECTDSPLAVALLRMRDQLQKISEEEKERNWATEGLARFVEILRKNTKDITELGNMIISHVIKYLGANQGCLFTLVEDVESEEVLLEMVACYAYERKKYINKKVKAGEGLLGQVFLEKETTYLTQIPEEYITITSGLGKATPSSLLLVPLKVNDKVYGVMELASFNVFEPYQIRFLEKLAENIASSLSSVKMNKKTQALLEESQIQTEQMRSQDEEMRQNLEEMTAIQEQLKRREQQSASISKKYQDILNGCEDAVIIVDERGIIEYVNTATLNIFGYTKDELIRENVKILMRTEHAVKHDQYLRNYLQTGVKKFMGSGREEKVLTKDGKSIPVLISLSEANGEEGKIFTAFIKDLTKYKEVNANKNKITENSH